MKSKPARRQDDVRRYGASLGLVAAALLVSRFVTPSGASSPLVLLGATAAVAWFGGRWPAIAATITAALVNGFAIGLGEIPRLSVESSMILLLGLILAFRVPRPFVEEAESSEPIQAEAVVTAVAPPREESASIGLAESPRPQPKPVKAESADEAPGVLVIHGNAVLRLAIRSTLTGLGYRVRDAADMTQADSLLAERTFGAVVADVGRVDDYSLASVERLRQAMTTNDSVLLTLAHADGEDDRELLMAAGADVVLPKPMDTTGVAAKLREVFPPPASTTHSRVGLGASP